MALYGIYPSQERVNEDVFDTQRPEPALFLGGYVTFILSSSTFPLLHLVNQRGLVGNLVRMPCASHGSGHDGSFATRYSFFYATRFMSVPT